MSRIQLSGISTITMAKRQNHSGTLTCQRVSKLFDKLCGTKMKYVLVKSKNGKMGIELKKRGLFGPSIIGKLLPSRHPVA